MPIANLDICILIPSQHDEFLWMDSAWRRTRSSSIYLQEYARREFEEYLGFELDPTSVQFGSEPIHKLSYRSSTAILLGTHLESAGLAWKIIDPRDQPLSYWKRQIKLLRDHRPRIVGISTSYAISSDWFNAICSMIRSFLPQSKLLIGGSLYSTSIESFFALDADIYCVGEADLRLVEMVRCVLDGRDLESIPGLFLRQPRGPLKFTGSPPPVDLNALPMPDWSLCGKIDPPLSLHQDNILRVAQTQRGCGYNCSFCSVRASIQHRMMSANEAVENILAAGVGARGILQLGDATATSPRSRWEKICKKLIRLGGAPLPLSLSARISDINPHFADLMFRAGVREVCIGLESGSQQLLNKMKKGIKVNQVLPAIRTLSERGIFIDVSFMLGYPGETEQSAAATRQLILRLNEAFPHQPAVIYARIQIFEPQDLSGFAESSFATDCSSPDLRSKEQMTFEQAERERFITYIAMSQSPHAPVSNYLIKNSQARYALISMSHRRNDIFSWLKAADRGMAIFMERHFFKTAPDLNELREIKGILSRFAIQESAFHAAVLPRVYRLARKVITRRVAAEWKDESASGVGLITRALLGFKSTQLSGRLIPGVASALAGEFHYSCGFNADPSDKVLSPSLREDVLSSCRIDKITAPANSAQSSAISLSASGTKGTSTSVPSTKTEPLTN